jgi:cytochrome c2
VEAIGHQWWFEFRYPGEEIVTANELHIPVGRPVTFKLTSQDVIHSYWVPQLAGKLDMVPINENEMWFQADEPGVYFGQCAEFCGIAHALMRFRVIAEPQEDYDAWVASMSRAPDTPAPNSAEENGQRLFAANCSSCHNADSYRDGGYRQEIDQQDGRWAGWLADTENARVVSAPSLTHMGLRSTLGAGITELTEDNLITWITDPSDIKVGTRMQQHAAVYQTPDGKANLERQQIIDIAKYLMSLVPGEGEGDDEGTGGGSGDLVADGEAAFSSNGCSACHSTGSNTVVGPGLAGIGGRAGDRVPGLSADDYLAQSLREPGAFVVDGFAPIMSSFSHLSADDVNSLVAYLKTLN